MKYYETTWDEYITSQRLFNLHPELQEFYNNMPKQISNFENLIIHGPPGVGKYTQTLCILKNYSNSDLKYDKKLTIQNEKNQYTLRISDIHYEIDMSLLGCNSKILWHDIFLQIVDIISVKSEKVGIIVCKNFHKISADLLEVFYSYMQQYNSNQATIKLRYILIMDSVSFLPSQILNACYRLKIKRPSTERYNELITHNERLQENNVPPHDFIHRVKEVVQPIEVNIQHNNKNSKKILDTIGRNGILNLKELRSLSLITTTDQLPTDMFNLICDNIIREITNVNDISFTNFRDALYDILTYNLEISDCIWYIISHFIESGNLNEEEASDVLSKTYSFLKYFNNNYRPIYHLENMMLYITSKIHNFDEL